MRADIMFLLSLPVVLWICLRLVAGAIYDGMTGADDGEEDGYPDCWEAEKKTEEDGQC